MNDNELLDKYPAVRIATAAAILGGDGEPVSSSTVYRLIKDGTLERVGRGKVSTASLKAYVLNGRPAKTPPR